MFYNLATGKIDSPDTHGPSLWRADDLVFIDAGCAMLSFNLDDEEMDSFCRFIEEAIATEGYIDFKDDGPFIAFEDRDEGYRNLCIYDGRVQMIINLKMQNLIGLPDFLRSQIKTKSCTDETPVSLRPYAITDKFCLSN